MNSYMPGRGNANMGCKYDDKRCVCGEIETDYVLFECVMYVSERDVLKNVWGSMITDIYEAINRHKNFLEFSGLPEL